MAGVHCDDRVYEHADVATIADGAEARLGQAVPRFRSEGHSRDAARLHPARLPPVPARSTLMLPDRQAGPTKKKASASIA